MIKISEGRYANHMIENNSIIHIVWKQGLKKKGICVSHLKWVGAQLLCICCFFSRLVHWWRWCYLLPNLRLLLVHHSHERCQAVPGPWGPPKLQPRSTAALHQLGPWRRKHRRRNCTFSHLRYQKVKVTVLWWYIASGLHMPVHVKVPTIFMLLHLNMYFTTTIDKLQTKALQVTLPRPQAFTTSIFYLACDNALLYIYGVPILKTAPPITVICWKRSQPATVGERTARCHSQGCYTQSQLLLVLSLKKKMIK